MKITKKILTFLIAVGMVFTITACSDPVAPYIGDNGNWFVNGEDTGVPATGEAGIKGDNGEDGSVLVVSAIEKIKSESDLAGVATDTYQITFSSGLKVTYDVKNGYTPSVLSCNKVASTDDGTVYKLVFSNGDEVGFTVENGKDGTATATNIERIYSSVFGMAPIVATSGSLASGASLYLEENAVMGRKHLSASMDLTALTENSSVHIGHGVKEYASSYLEITSTKVIIHRHYTDDRHYTVEYDHGLNIKNWLKVNIDVEYDKAKIQVMTPDGGLYEKDGISWEGRNGKIFTTPYGISVSDVKMSWFSDDYSASVYMIGDSYFNAVDSSRWTSYLLNEGYNDNLMISFPGMASKRGITEFKQAVEKGTPQYAFWCMGMNDGDRNGQINENWLSATEEFLNVCNEKGIVPILSTIPSTTKDGQININNNYKNAWVRSSGYRFVDFDKAVVKDALTGEWYTKMLSSDSVHPNLRGAQALYMQTVSDFPEIMRKR